MAVGLARRPWRCPRLLGARASPPGPAREEAGHPGARPLAYALAGVAALLTVLAALPPAAPGAPRWLHIARRGPAGPRRHRVGRALEPEGPHAPGAVRRSTRSWPWPWMAMGQALAPTGLPAWPGMALLVAGGGGGRAPVGGPGPGRAGQRAGRRRRGRLVVLRLAAGGGRGGGLHAAGHRDPPRAARREGAPGRSAGRAWRASSTRPSRCWPRRPTPPAPPCASSRRTRAARAASSAWASCTRGWPCWCAPRAQALGAHSVLYFDVDRGHDRVWLRAADGPARAGARLLGARSPPIPSPSCWSASSPSTPPSTSACCGRCPGTAAR